MSGIVTSDVSRRIRCLGAAGALLLAFSASAQGVSKQGDLVIRAGAGHVAPNDKSGDFTGVAGGRVSVGDSTGLAINFTYMLRDHLGVELLGSLPFTHDIKGAGALAGAGKVAEVKQLPPTLILLYHFTPESKLRPYLGAGLNYTIFFDEKPVGALAGTSLKLKDSAGAAVEGGLDFDLGDNLTLNASVWWMDIDTTATSSAVGTAKVQIDPVVFFVGMGWKF